MTMTLEGGEGVNITPRLLFTPGKDPVPIVQEAGWGLELIWAISKSEKPLVFAGNLTMIIGR